MAPYIPSFITGNDDEPPACRAQKRIQNISQPRTTRACQVTDFICRTTDMRPTGIIGRITDEGHD